MNSPGSSFPSTASVDISKVDGRDTVYVGTGEIMYALDAVTGEEIWRFTAGTGCKDAFGNPPGLCGFLGERNQIESSAAVVDGQVFFAMDINDYETGKGGFYSVDAATGTLNWYFDLETGATCTPLPGDDIRQFDGYHSEAQLGLPAGYLASRPGCGFDRTITGCGNVWSSPAIDEDARPDVLRQQQLRYRQQPRHAAARAAHARLRRGDRGAGFQRQSRVALAPARSRQRRPRLRRRAQPVHHRLRRRSRARCWASATRTAPTTCSTATA